MNRLSTRDALVLTAAGGFLGTLARWVVTEFLGSTDGLSAGIVLANTMGAGALGYLLARLASPTSGLERHRIERLNLFLGVGVLGAFTTYSTLAVHGAQLIEAGHWWSATWQVGAQILLGVGAALAGLVIGAARDTPAVSAEGAESR